MAETYRFLWGEVNQIIDGCKLARRLTDQVDYGHLETERFDLDFDRIGVVVRIPHDRILTEERKLDHEKKGGHA